MNWTRLLLIRHGETAWNIEGRLQGWQNSSLSELGMAQARRLAQSLVGLDPPVLMTSDAGRALATAGAIGEAIGRTPIADSRLREISFGELEGHVSSTLPPEVQAVRERLMGMDPTCTQAFPGGESPADVSKRVWSCLNEVASRHAGEYVVIVSHGGVLACVLRTVLGVQAGAPRRFRIGNTALVHLVRVEAGPWFLDFDDLDPLTPASRPA